ncbi:MAG: hypothetical protein H0W83_00190 [Planctomycetes bacterium]|nr:hypothetical protein [Planctomycetota bacterium]
MSTSHSRSTPSTVFVFRGTPSFMLGCCHEAAQGGKLGYEHVGWHLAKHLERLVPYEAEYDEWSQIIDDLDHVLIPYLDDSEPGPHVPGPMAEVMGGLVQHYPKVMALVPRRRWPSFYQGFFQARLDLHGWMID